MNKSVTTLLYSIAVAGCTAWIDDYYIDPEYEDESTDSSTSTSSADSDADSDSDHDTGVPISCDIMVTSPAGRDIEFCESEGTSFTMGCDEDFPGEMCEENELPRHRVTLSPFEIQRYETTYRQFELFVARRPEWEKGGSAAREYCNSSYLADWPEQGPSASMDQKPVQWVCWHAALAYCKWLGSGMSLPTEAMWESAARAGPTGIGGNTYHRFPFGDKVNCTIANYEGCEGAPLRVGQTTGDSPLGLYDMGGNAMEWIRDWHRDDTFCDPEGQGEYSQDACNESYRWTDPVGDATGHNKGVRGGSWYHPQHMMRAARRDGFSPNISSNLIGFRCAR